MGKRIVIGGLLAVGLSLALGGTAQAQHFGHQGHSGHGGYGGGGYGYNHGGYGNIYRSGPIFVTPAYRPVVIAPYGSFGTPYFPPTFGTPYVGASSNPLGYSNYSNITYSRPGFGISFGFRR